MIISRFLSVLVVSLSVGSLLIGTPAQAQEPPQTARPPLPGLGTTKGPFSKDINPEAIWDGRGMVAFKTLDMPKMVPAAEADFLDPAEYVLGVTVQGQNRAYPSRFIWWHHAINDRVSAPGKDDVFFAITYCSVCNTGVRYDLSLNGRTVKLDFFGLYNGVVALCDRETQSVFLQGEGRYVSGPLVDKQLHTAPLLDTTWKEWKRLHPDTLVMSPDNEFSKYYRPKDRQEARGYDRFPMPMFRPTVTRGDKRIPAFDKVLGVALPGKDADGKETVLRRAYPIKAVKEAGGVVNDTFRETPVAVFLDPSALAACAVSRRIDGRTLTFEARKGAGDGVTYYDKETGTRWSIEGRAEEGPMAGKSLERLDAHLSQWYGWFAYFPETSIYGRTDAPQPGDPFAGETAPAKPAGDEVKKL